MIYRGETVTVSDQIHDVSILPSMSDNRAVSFVDGCREAFSHLSFLTYSAARRDRIVHKQIGESAIAHASSSEPARAIPSTAYIPEYNAKILWQLGGTSSFHGPKISTKTHAGEAIVMPVTPSYELTTSGNYDILTLTFDIRRFPEWRSLLDSQRNRPVLMNSALRASAAAIQSALGSYQNDPLDVLTVDFGLDLFFRSMSVDAGIDFQENRRLSPRLHRAKAAIMRNISDPDYSPEQLARDVGLSKRSLYVEFQRYGLSPSAFIRDLRLQKSRSDILLSKGRQINITQIAFQNGFSDGSQFSRAFRARYGMSPNKLRLTV